MPGAFLAAAGCAAYNAAQALEFRRPARTSPYLEDFVEKYRGYVHFVEDDKVMYRDMESSVTFLREVEVDLPEDLLYVREYPPEDL
jgi:histidine ammonia-lyase